MSGPSYIADSDGLQRTELEGLCVLFHPRSGMTHIVAPPSPQILAALEAPATLEALLERLGAAYTFDQADGAAAVAARLAELEAAGLVRRA